ncbi:MAG TPA: lipid II flippase MurJ [Polyangiaceae bacterium]|nr:lipid II flippase MurJ [Polyangiaceae bacterium]
MIETEVAVRRSRPPALARTALGLLPLQIVLRAGEALLPLGLAAFFGRTLETDLYYVLAAYFVFVASVVAGAFQDSAVVPVLIEVAEGRPALFPGVAGSLLGHTLAFGGSVALGLGVFAALVAGVVSPLHVLALELVLGMSLATFAASVRAFYVGLLNARGVFRAHPIGSGLGMGLTWIVLFMGRRALGVRVVPVAMLTGEVLAIVVLRALTVRVLGLRLSPTLERSEPMRRILTLVRLELTGSLITRVNPLIDQLMAGLAGVIGGGTLLRYASDVAALPTSLLQATLFPVLLTRLSHEANRPPQLIATTRRTLVVVCAVLALLAATTVLVRRPLCVLLFGRGAMDPAGVARIASILPWAVAGSVPFGALLVLARAHVALQNSRIMPSMGLINSVLNAVFNAALVGVLGLSGIALSTSLTYAAVAFVFWTRLRSRVRS